MRDGASEGIRSQLQINKIGEVGDLRWKFSSQVIVIENKIGKFGQGTNLAGNISMNEVVGYIKVDEVGEG